MNCTLRVCFAHVTWKVSLCVLKIQGHFLYYFSQRPFIIFNQSLFSEGGCPISCVLVLSAGARCNLGYSIKYLVSEYSGLILQTATRHSVRLKPLCKDIKLRETTTCDSVFYLTRIAMTGGFYQHTVWITNIWHDIKWKQWNKQRRIKVSNIIKIILMITITWVQQCSMRQIEKKAFWYKFYSKMLKIHKCICLCKMWSACELYSNYN